MEWIPRLAERSDIPTLERLIEESSRRLLSGIYSAGQIERALGPIFGVDEQMIADGTYFVVGDDDEPIACGGWSFRESAFGGRAAGEGVSARLNPIVDAARIRAFFVHPRYVRKGIGTAILHVCEDALVACGFRRAEIAATLAGEDLYRRFGYETNRYEEIPLCDDNPPLRIARMSKRFPGEDYS